MLVPEIALTPQTMSRFQRALRRPRRAAALEDVGGRPLRRVAAAAQRRGPDRRRPALGRLRAGGRARPDRDRRGARLLLQAGVGPPLRRPRGRRPAGRAGRGRAGGRAPRRRAPRAGGRCRGSSCPTASTSGRCRRSRSSTCATTAAARRSAARSTPGRSRRSAEVEARGRQGDRPDQPPRLVGPPRVPLVRARLGVPRLRRLAGPAPLRQPPLPPLRPRRARARGVPRLRLGDDRPGRRRDAEGRVRGRGAARSAARLPDGLRRDRRRRGPRRPAAALRPGRVGSPGRHPDGRQGPRLPRRDARGRPRRRQLAAPAGLPLRGADLLADHPARGPQRPRAGRAARSWSRRSPPGRRASGARRATTPPGSSTRSSAAARSSATRRSRTWSRCSSPAWTSRRSTRPPQKVAELVRERLPGDAELLGPAPMFRRRGRNRRRVIVKAAERLAGGGRGPRRGRRGGRRAGLQGPDRLGGRRSPVSRVADARALTEFTSMDEPVDGAGRVRGGRGRPRARRRRARAPRRRAGAGGQVRRPGPEVAGIPGQRLRRRARARTSSGCSRSCATGWASASPPPSSGRLRRILVFQAGPDAPADRAGQPGDRVELRGGPRHRRGGLPQPPGHRRSTSSARSTSARAAWTSRRRAADDRGLGPRGPRPPARDRPPRRRPDPGARPARAAQGRDAGAARGRHLRARSASAEEDRADRGSTPSLGRLEDRLPRDLRVRGDRAARASPRASTTPALVVTPPDRKQGAGPGGRPAAGRRGRARARPRGPPDGRRQRPGRPSPRSRRRAPRPSSSARSAS